MTTERIRQWISRDKGAATLRNSPGLIRTAGCTGRGNRRKPKLSYLGNVLIDNRHGLVFQGEVRRASAKAEQEAGLAMAEQER